MRGGGGLELRAVVDVSRRECNVAWELVWWGFGRQRKGRPLPPAPPTPWGCGCLWVRAACQSVLASECEGVRGWVVHSEGRSVPWPSACRRVETIVPLDLARPVVLVELYETLCPCHSEVC